MLDSSIRSASIRRSDRAVKRWGPEAHLAGGAVEDVLHDAVAVLFSAGEGEHDVEPLRFKGEEG